MATLWNTTKGQAVDCIECFMDRYGDSGRSRDIDLFVGLLIRYSVVQKHRNYYGKRELALLT